MYVTSIGPSAGMESDTPEYEVPAWNLAQGLGISRSNLPTATREPGYIVFLAGLFFVFGRNWVVVQVIQSFLSAATVSLLVLLLFKQGLRKQGILLGVVLSVLPEFLGFSGLVMSEILHIFLYILFFISLFEYRKKGNILALLLASVFLGAASITRSVSLFLPFFLVFFGFLQRKRLSSLIKEGGVLFLGIVLFFGPWVYRNYLRFGQLIPTRVGSAQILWSGSYVPWNGEWLGENKSPMKELLVGENEIEVEKRFGRLFRDNLKKQPLETAAIWLKKPFKILLWPASYQFINPGFESILRSRISWKTLLIPLSFIVHWLILGFALLSVFKVKGEKLLRGMIGEQTLYFFLLHMPLSPIPRYNMQFLLLWAVLASLTAVEYLRNGNKV